MVWISNHKYKIEEKSAKSSWSSSKVVGLGLADLWEFPTLIMDMNDWNFRRSTIRLKLVDISLIVLNNNNVFLLDVLRELTRNEEFLVNKSMDKMFSIPKAKVSIIPHDKILIVLPFFFK